MASDPGPSWLQRIFGNGKVKNGDRHRTHDERLEDAFDEAQREGILDDEAHEMIRGVLDFAAAMVQDVMVPRTEIVAVEDTATLQELIDTILESGHSRIPVFNDTIDKIIGLVYAKDLLRHWGKDTLDLSQVLREPYFIPETKQLDDLMNDFRKKHIQLAIVIDEYGGTSGLVTIEDLLEEIVGEIVDEYDEDELLIQENRYGELTVSGRLPIDELYDYYGLDEPREKYTTVGGWISHHAGYIPRQGETFRIGAFEVIIAEADERTIKRAKVVLSRQGQLLPDGEVVAQ